MSSNNNTGLDVHLRRKDIPAYNKRLITKLQTDWLNVADEITLDVYIV